MRASPVLAVLVVSVACGRAPSTAAPAPIASVAPIASAAPSASAAPRGPCDAAMPCQVLASPAEAFDEVLATAPRVLAIGETHAQKDGSGRRRRSASPSALAEAGRQGERPRPRAVGRERQLRQEGARGRRRSRRRSPRTQARDEPERVRHARQRREGSGDRAARAHALVRRVRRASSTPALGDIDAMLTDDRPPLGATGSSASAKNPGQARGRVRRRDAQRRSYPRAGREAWSYGPRIAKHRRTGTSSSISSSPSS